MKISTIYHNNVQTVNQDQTISEAMKIIDDKKYNGILVVDNNEKVVGVLSVQDIAGAVVPEDFKENVSMAAAMYKPSFFDEQCQDIAKMKVKKVMRKDFSKVTLESNLMEVCADFLKNDLYVVPVFGENDELKGIVTRSEIKKAITHSMS